MSIAVSSGSRRSERACRELEVSDLKREAGGKRIVRANWLVRRLLEWRRQTENVCVHAGRERVSVSERATDH